MAFSTAAAAEDSGFSNTVSRVFPAKTAFDRSYTNIVWQTEAADTVGVMVTSGENVLMPQENFVYKRSEADGAILSSAELSSSALTQSRGAVIGNTMIQPTEKGISVINVQTMQEISFREFEGEISDGCAMIDSFAYFSAKSNGTETFYCLDISNGLETVWEYSSQSDLTPPAVYGKYVVFGAGETLVTHEKASGSATEIPLPTALSSAPYAGEYAVFFGGADGNVYKLRLTDDGTLEPDTLVSCEIGGKLSSPLSWNGRLYVCSDTGFYILDNLNMEITNSYPDIKSGSEPYITYGNGSRVYLVAPYENRYTLYSIYDIDELEQPQVTQLAVMDNYENGSAAVSKNGTMYFRDTYGRLFAVTILDYDIFSMVLKVILILALIVGVFIWLRALKKQKMDKMPKF